MPGAACMRHQAPAFPVCQPCGAEHASHIMGHAPDETGCLFQSGFMLVGVLKLSQGPQD